MISTMQEGRTVTAPGLHVAPVPHLTERESGVLDLMGQGLDPQMIAWRLAISIHTCREHQKNIFTKLDAHTQLEAVIIALRSGLIAWPGPLSSE